MESGDGASVIAINKVAKALGVLPENLIDRARVRAPLSDSYELDHEHVFVIGPVIRKPRQFFGREQTLRRLFALLKANPMQSSLIIGPSRSGKTSLLRHLEVITTTPANQLRSGQRNDWLPHPERYRWIFVDFNDPRLQSQEAVFRCFLDRLGLPSPSPCDQDRFSEVISYSLDQPTVVLMDGIDKALAFPDLDVSFWNGLRALTAADGVYGNLAYLTASSETPRRLVELFPHVKYSPFFNITVNVEKLGPLEDSEARALIGSSPRPFPPGDVDWITEQSSRWPFLLQILCRERLLALEAKESGDGWREEGLKQMERFRYLLSDDPGRSNSG